MVSLCSSGNAGRGQDRSSALSCVAQTARQLFASETDGRPRSPRTAGRALTLQGGPARLVLLPTGAGSPKLIPIAGVEFAGGMLLPGAKGFLVRARPQGRPVTEYFTVPPDGGKPDRSWLTMRKVAS